jgi:hypothetical protein
MIADDYDTFGVLLEHVLRIGDENHFDCKSELSRGLGGYVRVVPGARPALGFYDLPAGFLRPGLPLSCRC